MIFVFEGLLDNDKVLAGAIWRNFFEEKYPDTNPERLEILVNYIRRQVYLGLLNYYKN